MEKPEIITLFSFKPGDRVEYVMAKTELVGRRATVVRIVKSRNVVTIDWDGDAPANQRRYDAYPTSLRPIREPVTKSPARIAYEADVEAMPTYCLSGNPRKTWDQLSEAVQDTWKRNPTPRQYASEPTEQGNQLVIPGCERDRSRGPAQGDLF